MKNNELFDVSTDEDEDEKRIRLESIKGKTPEEIMNMKKINIKTYKVVFNIFQVR
jgi:hypothetical protein